MPFKKKTLVITSEEEMEKSDPIELTKFSTVPDAPTNILKTTDFSKKPSKLAFILSEIKQMRIEFFMFLYTLSFAVRSVSQTTIMIDKVCLVHFNHSPDICSNISYYPDIKSQVVKLANNYVLGHNFLLYLPASIFVIFIGSWSDKYSRKIPLIAALAGMIIDDVGITLSAVFMNTRVELIYIAAFFNGFSGGFVVVMAVLYSYVSDISTVSNRTIKFNLFQASFGFSWPLGILASGYIFMYFGYVVIFSIATIGHILALIWVIFAIRETRGLENKESWKTKLINLISTENAVESIRAAMKKRPNQGRKQILLLMICMSLGLLHQTAVASIGFSYVHHRYNWDNTKYSTAFGVFAMLGTLSMLFIVPIFKRMKLGDLTIGIVGSVSMISKSILTGVASNETIYYIANLVGMLDLMLPLASRSRISKVIPAADIGKIFSFLSMVESVFPVIASAAVAQIFNATLDFYSGLIFVVLGVMSLFKIGVFLWISRLPKCDYDEKDGEEKEEKPEDIQKKDLNENKNVSSTEKTELSHF